MTKSNKAEIRKDLLFKRAALTIMVMLLLIAIGTIVSSADTYYSIRIEYLFRDGTPAHDPYVATYLAGEDVSDTVTNPNIDGFVPMTAVEGGDAAETTSYSYSDLSESHTFRVYYLAGMTHYRALYYKQNIYDDLYTRDTTVPANLTDRYGLTGSNPTDLEDLQFEGFTNLFHEPDAIAADGSTVFRVYYDRNYYSVMFDLGENGYGLEPVYAKYQSVYHISEPKRMGFTFKGWLQTDKDSAKGAYLHSTRGGRKGNRSEDTRWKFVDENGDELLDSNGEPIFDENGIPTAGHEAEAESYYLNFTEGTVPAHDSYYKAVWTSGTTGYSVVYWFQNPDGRDLTAKELNEAGSIEAARTLISTNYSVGAAKDVENVTSGELINLETRVKNAQNKDVAIKDFFEFDLTENGDFPSMSQAMRDELLGKSKFYEYASAISQLQFGGAYEDDPEKTHIEVAGDGTTRINVYYNRVDFTLKFYYARQKLVDGQPTGEIDLTNSTKNFSKNPYGAANKYMNAVAQGTWQPDATDTLPHIKDKYLVANGGILTEKYVDHNGYRYYYYQVESQYNAPLAGKWLIDAITSVPKKNYPGQISEPGSWAVERYTYYYSSHVPVNNFTVKGIYEKLGDELMFEDRENTLQELHYLLSWTNTSRSNDWNYGNDRILHFTYENYVELLPYEIEKMTIDNDGDGDPDGPQSLIDEGIYENIYVRKTNTSFEEVNPSAVFAYDSSKKYYGLKTENRIETTDSGSQYPIDNLNKKTNSVRTDQVPTDLTGFKIINFDNKNEKGQIVLDSTNTVVDWSDDTNTYRHATVKFFYNRNHYTLKWRNGNRLEERYTRDVMYGAPLNSQYTSADEGHIPGDYRYWFDDPQYFNEDLRDYYNFIGWYYTPYYYRMVDKDTATMPADDTALYARWDPKIINVSFYPTYNDFYEGTNLIGEEIPVNYGDYVPMEKIPANTDDENSTRPKLSPPVEGASFAGWYYMRDNIPVRFEPENIPVTALNSVAVKEGKLQLFAEWVAKDVGRYKVTYVEKDHPEVEVAPPTTGRVFVWKTKTFNAKGGDELNADHAWVEDAANWWPTTTSHSIVIKANNDADDLYKPNKFTFEYVKKQSVWYKVQYLDAATLTPLSDPVIHSSTHASVKEDALMIPGYLPQVSTQTLTLSASTAGTEQQQKAEELEHNVINFYYEKNDKDRIYEVQYYKQNIDDDSYTLYQNEYLTVPIADPVVSLSTLYANPLPLRFEQNGFTRVANGTTVDTTDVSTGTTVITHPQDDASVTIGENQIVTVKIYFDRNTYPYQYQYVDYRAEQKYNQMVEAGEDVTNVWNGVMATFNGTQQEKVEEEVPISAPLDYEYDDGSNVIPYTRVDDKAIVLTIGPVSVENPDINHVKVYYKKFTEREINYKLVCNNESSPYTEIDYDPATGDPLYGGLSLTHKTIEKYSDIPSVTFYNFNDATDSHGVTLHDHKYNFLGWFDNPEGTGTPLCVDEVLSPEELGLNESIPERDITYYAVVEQQLVTANFEFRLLESADDLPLDDYDDHQTASDVIAAENVKNAPIDADGSMTGCYFSFTIPAGHENNTPVPWLRTAGYSVSIEPKPGDNKAYKYEFAEWFEEDLTKEGHPYVRKKNWSFNAEGWAPTTLQGGQVDCKTDKHIIAVFVRREVTEMPYTINYHFTDRFGDDRKYVVKGTLTGDQLDESKSGAVVTTNGDFRLTDDFIMQRAPYESNHAKTLVWTDRDDRIQKTSLKGDGETSVDQIITDVTAEIDDKTVYANYCTAPGGEYSTITCKMGDNYELNPAMEAITADETDGSGNAFSSWEVRKSSDPASPVVAKSDKLMFDLCMMDTYYITPVYGSEEEEPTAPTITLTSLDTSRNRWTDDDGNPGENGTTDRLFNDFEVAYMGLDDLIMNNEDYKVGMVFERCATMPESMEFDPTYDYNQMSDETNLKAAIKTALDNNAGSIKYVYNPDTGKTRTVQINPLSNEGMTNRNRVEVGKYYNNTGKNKDYLIKVYAYLRVGDEITLSNPVYMCLKAEALKDLAVDLQGMTDYTTP